MEFYSSSLDLAVCLTALYLRGIPRVVEPPRQRWRAVEAVLRREGVGYGQASLVLKRFGFWPEASALDPALPDALALVEAGRVITAADPLYPKRWLQVLGDAAPPVVWVSGDVSALAEFASGRLGARRTSGRLEVSGNRGRAEDFGVQVEATEPGERKGGVDGDDGLPRLAGAGELAGWPGMTRSERLGRSGGWNESGKGEGSRGPEDVAAEAGRRGSVVSGRFGVSKGSGVSGVDVAGVGFAGVDFAGVGSAGVDVSRGFGVSEGFGDTGNFGDQGGFGEGGFGEADLLTESGKVGSLGGFESQALTVVGSRTLDEWHQAFARAAGEAAAPGLLVSGGAPGADAVAAQSAWAAGGTVLEILPCGLASRTRINLMRERTAMIAFGDRDGGSRRGVRDNVRRFEESGRNGTGGNMEAMGDEQAARNREARQDGGPFKEKGETRSTGSRRASDQGGEVGELSCSVQEGSFNVQKSRFGDTERETREKGGQELFSKRDSRVDDLQRATGASEDGLWRTSKSELAGSGETGCGRTGFGRTGVGRTGFGNAVLGEIDSEEIDSEEVDFREVDVREVDVREVESGKRESGPIDFGEIDSGPIDFGKIGSGAIDFGREDRDPGSRWISLSVCAPWAEFSAQAAMERNALLYAFSPVTIVCHARFKEGGSWHGATSAIRRRLSSIVVPGDGSLAYRALIGLGAMPVAGFGDVRDEVGDTLETILRGGLGTLERGCLGTLDWKHVDGVDRERLLRELGVVLRAKIREAVREAQLRPRQPFQPSFGQLSLGQPSVGQLSFG